MTARTPLATRSTVSFEDRKPSSDAYAKRGYSKLSDPRLLENLLYVPAKEFNRLKKLLKLSNGQITNLKNDRKRLKNANAAQKSRQRTADEVRKEGGKNMPADREDMIQLLKILFADQTATSRRQEIPANASSYITVIKQIISRLLYVGNTNHGINFHDLEKEAMLARQWVTFFSQVYMTGGSWNHVRRDPDEPARVDFTLATTKFFQRIQAGVLWTQQCLDARILQRMSFHLIDLFISRMKHAKDIYTRGNMPDHRFWNKIRNLYLATRLQAAIQTLYYNPGQPALCLLRQGYRDTSRNHHRGRHSREGVSRRLCCRRETITETTAPFPKKKKRNPKEDAS